MNICVDIQPLQYSTRDAGIGFYLRNLLREMHRLPSRHSFKLFRNGHARRQSDFRLDPGLDWPMIVMERELRPGLPAWCSDKRSCSELMRRAQTDLFHANSMAEFNDVTIPDSTGSCKVVVTVHDIIPVLFKEQHPAYWPGSPNQYDYEKKLRDVCAADGIITVSHHSKNDLIKHLSIPAEKICVTHNAVSRQFHPVKNHPTIQRVRSRYRLPASYILYVGGYYSQRKNLHGLLSAYRRFQERSRLSHYSLVLAGARSARAAVRAEIDERLRDPILKHRVQLTEFIPEADLPTLFSEAEVFIYPSHYEGFGLTPLQAMACGTAVVTANNSAIPEVAGDAAELVDSEDTNALADALIQVLSDGNRRRQMIRKGLARSRRFSWRRSAIRTMDFYQQLLDA